MAFGNLYTVGFAAGICVVCSSMLAGISVSLRDLQEANARRDLYKNILEALDLPETENGVRPSISGEAIDELWADKVELRAVSPTDGSILDVAAADLDQSGAFDNDDIMFAREQAVDGKPKLLGVFIRKDNGTVALPMTGNGLWGPISAYVAFDPKLTEVKGVSFFAPKETPGLGAEITNPPFEQQWIGKSITDGSKTVPIRVPKPSECAEKTDEHCVDGVSGATITSRGVDAMIASSLSLYEPYIQTVR